jgi:hypothetical protein
MEGASVHKDPCGGLYHEVYRVMIFSRSFIVAGWLVASWTFLYSILLSSEHSREASKAPGIIGDMEKEFLTHSRLQLFKQTPFNLQFGGDRPT